MTSVSKNDVLLAIVVSVDADAPLAAMQKPAAIIKARIFYSPSTVSVLSRSVMTGERAETGPQMGRYGGAPLNFGEKLRISPEISHRPSYDPRT
ncbi:MAG: hypothetical protein AAFY52_08585 [Pseudomonadota bacterium]